MLIPVWLQTPYGYGESPNGNFLSPSPFPYGDPHMETVKPNGYYSHMVIFS